MARFVLRTISIFLKRVTIGVRHRFVVEVSGWNFFLFLFNKNILYIRLIDVGSIF